MEGALTRFRDGGFRTDNGAVGSVLSRLSGVTALGASRSLRRVPATVSFLNPQPALRLANANRPSCPLRDLGGDLEAGRVVWIAGLRQSSQISLPGQALTRATGWFWRDLVPRTSECFALNHSGPHTEFPDSGTRPDSF